MDNYVKGVKVIEIYDAANKELLVKYDDKHNIDKVISALNIKSWKETEKSIGMNPTPLMPFAELSYTMQQSTHGVTGINGGKGKYPLNISQKKSFIHFVRQTHIS